MDEKSREDKLMELKSKGYDLIARMESTKAELDRVNAEISKLMQEDKKIAPSSPAGQ